VAGLGRQRPDGKFLPLVQFRLAAKYLYKGKPSAKAVDIQGIFPTDVENPNDHREVSVVDSILKRERHWWQLRSCDGLPATKSIWVMTASPTSTNNILKIFASAITYGMVSVRGWQAHLANYIR
jgi:hypothetical protein